MQNEWLFHQWYKYIGHKQSDSNMRAGKNKSNYTVFSNWQSILYLAIYDNIELCPRLQNINKNPVSNM